MSLADNLLFTWAYRIGKREFIIEIFRDGNCLLYDETIRRQLSHVGKTPQSILLEEIEADEPSAARARKTEFAIRLKISGEHLDLVRQVREEFDQNDYVPADLEREINSRFDPIFTQEVKPFLSVPLAGDLE